MSSPEPFVNSCRGYLCGSIFVAVISLGKPLELPSFFQSPDPDARPKSTGVFQDEELLFSHKLQKDNDPDVDLFSGTKKTRVSFKGSSHDDFVIVLDIMSAAHLVLFVNGFCFKY